MKPISTRTALFLSLSTLLGLFACANLPGGQDKDPYKKVVSIEGITEYQIPANGVRFLLFPDPTASSVTINMTVLVGSRHEGYGETGMAHLLEHMLFKGCKAYPDTNKALIDHGAGKEANATTWTDRTNYYETMPATDKNLEFGIHLESDRLQNAFIKREDLVKEMTVVRNEFENGENNPASILNQRMMAVAFEWHNYGKSTIGNRSDIERVPIDRLQAFYKKYYRPDNIVVAVAGKFDEGKARDLIVKYFGALKNPEGTLANTYTEEPAQDGERTVTLRRVGKVAMAGVMYHIPSVSHEEHAAVDVLSTILADEPSGRLYKALVDTKKATTVGGGTTAWHDPGILEMTADVADKVSPEEVRDILLDTIEKFAKEAPTQAEVDRAVTQYLSARERAMTKSKTIALQLTEWIGAGDWRLLFIHRDRVAKVTPADVQKVAAKYLKQSNRTVGLYIPTTEVARTPVPPPPDVAALVKDYKGGATIAEGETFDPTPENIEKRVQRLTLASGVKVALLPKKTRGEAVVGSMTLRWGNDKTLVAQGTPAAFIGPLMMRGTKKHDRQEIQDMLDKLKSSLAGSSGAGTLTFGWQSKRAQLPAVLELLREVLREPIFPEKEFSVIKNETKQALDKNLTDPQALAMRAFQRTLNPYPKDHVLYTPTLQESLERLEKTTIADVVRLYKEQVGAAVGEIVLVGDFDVDKTVKQFETMLADWKSAVPYQRIPQFADTKVPAVRENILTPDKEGATFVSGVAFAYKDEAPDYAALRLGNYILGDNYNSRMWNRLREKDGLCYGVGSRLRADAQDPYTTFTTFAICNPENIDKVDKGMAEETTKAIKEGVTAVEVEGAKKGFLQDMKVQRANDTGIRSMLSDGLYLGRTMKFQADLEKKIAALTVEDVNRALATHLAPSMSRMIVIRAGDFNKKGGGGDKK